RRVLPSFPTRRSSDLGDPVARGRVTERAGTISGCVERARRGVNVVEVHAPPGTVLYWLELRGTPDPLGRAPSPQHCHSPYSTDTDRKSTRLNSSHVKI